MKDFVECENAKVVQLIKTISTRGDGTSANPSRYVTKFWTLDGKLLFEVDNVKSDNNSRELKDEIITEIIDKTGKKTGYPLNI